MALDKVSNYPGGLCDRAATPSGNLPPDPMGLSKMAFLDPTRNIVFFTDFVADLAGIPIATSGLAAAGAATPWVLTVTEAGAGDASSAIADVNGGAITFLNDAADNDLISVQSRSESFLWSASKRLYFECRFKVLEVIQSDVYLGLVIRDTSLVASAPSDGFYFVSADAAATMAFKVVKNSTASTLAALTLVADTYVTLAFLYDPDTALFRVYVNDALVGTLASTNAVDDEELAITFAIQNGEAVANSMTIDWLFVALER